LQHEKFVAGAEEHEARAVRHDEIGEEEFRGPGAKEIRALGDCVAGRDVRSGERFTNHDIVVDKKKVRHGSKIASRSFAWAFSVPPP
jgi:hypothetical protein